MRKFGRGEARDKNGSTDGRLATDSFKKNDGRERGTNRGVEGL
jgi:hypothetical protein